jgi:hypothetical protein
MEMDTMTAGPSTAVFLHHPQPSSENPNSMLKALSAASSPLSQEIHADEWTDPHHEYIKPDPDDPYAHHTTAFNDPLSTTGAGAGAGGDPYLTQLPVSPGVGGFVMEGERRYDFGYTPDYALGYGAHGGRGLRYSTSMPHLSSNSSSNFHLASQSPSAMDEVVQSGGEQQHEGFAYDMQTYAAVPREIYSPPPFEPGALLEHPDS